MKRRDFVKAVAAAGPAAAGMSIATASGYDAVRERARAAPRKQALMKVGCQHGGPNEENFEFLARHGVFNMDPGMPRIIEGVGWDLDHALQIVEAAAEYGISVDAYHLPLSSAGIDKIVTPHIMLGKSPERDREIEMIQQMIEVAAKSGVHTLLYNTIILPVLRTERTVDPTRGNSSYSTWNYQEALENGMDKEMTAAGWVDSDAMYERITYFLDRVLPVAEEYDVKLGNHIADPPVAAGYRGITRWNSPDVREGIRRFAQLYDSPSHGFNLCLGSTAEGLEDPKTEIIPIVEWLGRRGQIFNIHMRNIKGGWNHFQEVWPDNGEMDSRSTPIPRRRG